MIRDAGQTNLSVMTEPAEAPRRRRRTTPASPPPPAGSVARGLALVVVAFLVGVVLLRDDDGVAAVGQVGASSVAGVPDPGGPDPDPETSTTVATTTVPVRAQSEVEVLVANGSGVSGAAKSLTDQAIALGYLTGEPTNAPGRVPSTTIYYIPGYVAEAQRLATELSPTAPPAITPMPTEAPVDELAGAHLLVVLGPDLASAGG